MKQSLRREVIEELLQAPEAPVSLSHLVCALGEDRLKIRRVMEHLVRLKAVTVMKRYERPPRRGRPTQEIVYRARSGIEQLLGAQQVENSARERIWRAVRALSKRGPFTRGDVASLASATMANVREYTKTLRRAGLLKEVSRGNWILKLDPGPARPATPKRRRGCSRPAEAR
jgi:DNA-binding transcriptional ArsR family regulator